MARYIDADELVQWSEKVDLTEDGGIDINVFDEYVQNAPTIDAVPVVRCKDCRWWYKKIDESPYGYCYACKHGHISEHWEIRIYRTYKSDWYCADGEREDDV